MNTFLRRLAIHGLAMLFMAAAARAAGPIIIPSGVHDVSPPLRNIPPATGGIRHVEAEREILPKFYLFKNLGADPLLSGGGGHFAAPAASAPSLLSSFEGGGSGLLGFSNFYIPPDTNGDVGLSHYVQWLNGQITIFDKTTGAVVHGPVDGNTLWTGYPTTDGNSCASHNNGDPIVQYDQINDRWVLTQFDYPKSEPPYGPYFQCVAVSTTPDPTGSYNRYDFQFNNYFIDYPKLGVWPDAYYMTWNLFDDSQPGGPFVGGEACALDRANMLAGNAATAQCFGPIYDLGGGLPPDLDGSTLPPAGEAAIFVTTGQDLSSNPALLDWKFHVDWSTPANSTFTGPNYISTASFTPACASGPNPSSYNTNCIPQKSTGWPLDSLSDLTMYRLAYRNRGGTESLLVNHSVSPGILGTGYSGVRWYELRLDVSGDPSVFQQGTFAPADGKSRWNGSIAMDAAGNIAVGYSMSSLLINPTVAFAGRTPSDPAGTISGETILKSGSASQTGYNRWGDYSSLSLDPTDDCTFWYTGEYYTSSGSNWRTRIGSFKFPITAPSISGPTFVCARDPLSLSADLVFDSYQWYLGNVLINGATGQTYSVGATSGNDQGSYTVVGKFGKCSSLVSSSFAVTVDAPVAPAVSGQTGFCLGNQLQLSATASASAYQWSLDTGSGPAPISGATSATYTVASAGPGDAGGYTVTATDASSCTSLPSPVFGVVLQPCAVQPQGLVVDAAGNGVFEPGETVIVDPTWKNTSGAADSVTGAASAFSSGPPTYSISVGSANYGSIPGGQPADCTSATGNCFSLGVTVPTTRPSIHWDSHFTETPSDGSTAKVWTLHLGNSFTDVPSSDAFYRDIETILHNNVTLGCGTGSHGQGLFCESATTSRGEMAAFVSRAMVDGDASVPVSGTGYNCVPAGSSNFADVPPTDMFCKHVNYLFVHGITLGCDSVPDFCESLLLSRGQMSAFIARAIVPGGDANVPVSGSGYNCAPAGSSNFTDVAPTDPFCRHINYLFVNGIVSGFGGGLFGPNDPVTRGASAKFLTNGFNLKLYGP